MYYKLLSENKIVDVVEDPEFVRYQTRNGIFISCEKEYAQAIISSDGQFIWQLKDRPEIPGDLATVELREIPTVEEYEEIKAKLESDVSVTNPDEPGHEEIEETPDPEQEKVMGITEMRIIISELSASLEEQTKRNDFLEECLLEMSEIVYA